VVVNWRVYGTNGWEHPPDGLVIDNYPLRAPDDHPANRLVKSIVYPRKTLGAGAQPAHYFRLRGNPVGEDKRSALSHIREPTTTGLLRINHYYAKSEEGFRRKAARPNAAYAIVQDRFPPPAAAVEDDSILQFRPDLVRALETRPGFAAITV